MTPGTAQLAQARAMVLARLGREPQDMLEAAVVLEAWAGLPAPEALRLGREIVAGCASDAQPSAGTPMAPAAGRGFALEACSFVIAVIAMAAWAVPLSSSLGADTVGAALTLALPVTLGLQWGLASRYLGRPGGLVHLGRRPVALLLLAWLALVAAPAAGLGRTGALAGLLTLTWTGGAILVRRRWSVVYVAIVMSGSAAMLEQLPPLAVVGGSAALTTFAVLAALRGHGSESTAPPGRWARALVAAVIGAGVGTLLVSSGSIDSDLGAIPAIGLLPSSLASIWGASHLWRFQHVIPRALAGASAVDAREHRLAAAPLRIVLGTVLRVVVLTAALSALLVAGAHALHLRAHDDSVLIGFGLLALATLFVSLLEAVGRSRWAVVAIAGGIAAEAALVPAQALRGLSGGGLIVGASVAIVIALPVVLATLGRPATTLATNLGIR